MRRNVIETVIGAIVLAVAALFVVFVYTRSSIQAVKGYEVTARFDRIDGIEVGSDVRISGIKVGTVVDLELDPELYMAVSRLSLDPKIRLPVDTVAKVTSDSLLGSKYMALDPGGEEEFIAPNGEIKFTQSSVSIEDLVGRFMFSPEKSGANKSDAGG